METNKKLQNLIGKIIGKDYFKLEFGCKVKVLNKASDYYSGREFIVTDTEDAYGHITVIVPNYSTIGLLKSDVEIIGQEPTLNDVLLAIEKSNIRKKGCIDLSIEDDNYLEVFCDGNYEFETLLVRIGLSKSIFNQEEEVKVAIINLLEDN